MSLFDKIAKIRDSIPAKEWDQLDYVTWKGKALHLYTKEELIDVIEQMARKMDEDRKEKMRQHSFLEFLKNDGREYDGL